MLQYIYNTCIVSSQYSPTPNIDCGTCILLDCIYRSNRSGFITIFKYIVTNGLCYSTDWYLLTKYLLDAIQLYPPHSKLADSILNSIMRAPWSKPREQVLKQVISLSKNKLHLLSTQYSHLVPDLEPKHNHIELAEACTTNNVDEVKHRLQYFNPQYVGLYDAITSPLDNKESLALVLPFLTDESCGNTFLISAYMNNKLPDYRIPMYENDLTMRAVICHFTGDTNLEGAVFNNSIIYIAYKFNFDLPLLYNCVMESIVHDYWPTKLPIDMQHKFNSIAYKINETCVSPCDCEFCVRLESY